MKIVLIGYRGTGKSCVADLLSERLRWPVFHMDREIVARATMSIPQIVAQYGWDHFRDLESEAVLEASKQDRLIIDAGGGVIVRDNNLKFLRQNSITVWLKARSETIADRIKNDAQRPSLTTGKSFLEEIDEVLAERTPRYQSVADSEIDTDLLSPGQVAEKILALMEEKGGDNVTRVTSG
jgi:shikimate kinase